MADLPTMTTAELPADKRIALVAHDHCKPALLQWVSRHREVLSQHELCATGTTGHLIREHTGLTVECMISGPMGGDQQIGAAISNRQVHVLIFFWDPHEPMPHDPDIKALLRIASVWNIPVACNEASADLLVTAPMFSRPLRHSVPDLDAWQRRASVESPSD